MHKRCHLQCLANQSKRIQLPENEKIILGRNPETGIEDPHLSRKHIECTAKLSPNHLLVKPIGKCYSGCNGYAFLMNENYHLVNDDVLELRLGFHKFRVVFEDETANKPLDKRQNYHPIFNVGKCKVKQNTAGGNMEGKWESIDEDELIIFTPHSCTSKAHIASFDIDGTIIKTKSGARYPKDKDDWEINLSVVPKTMKELNDKNYKIVFFTNQAGVGKNSDKIKDFKCKIVNIVKFLGLPIHVFVALGKGIYRKPLPGMWNILCDMKNDNIQVNIQECFFVGDAAGREKDWAPKRKKDHSNADRLFALNIGLKFFTPEEYFLKTSKNPFKMPLFDPRHFMKDSYPNYSSDKQDVILMVGSQGSGKSHFAKSQLLPKGYVHINRDTLKSWEKCVLMLEECIAKGKNAVIDNTNPDKASRKKYISIAKKHNVQCRCLVMSTTFEHCRHNNKFRGLVDKTHEVINDMLLYSYRKNFEQPDKSEGFDDIITVPFIPSFKSEDDEKLYKMFLLES